jgi:hypothetical protein
MTSAAAIDDLLESRGATPKQRRTSDERAPLLAEKAAGIAELTT